LVYGAKAQQYKPVDEKSDIKFVIKNFGLNTSGSLNGLKGTINFDPSNPGASPLMVSVEVTPVNTGSDARDNHLKKEEYFNV
jgi:polyisoprenoid-binding protein YceI